MSKQIERAHQAQSLSLLLVGKTGNGKSSLGNSLLGRECFATSADGGSMTKHCYGGKATFENGLQLTVFDTPGLCDTDLTRDKAAEQTMQAFSYAIRCSPNGFNAIVIVLGQPPRMTREEVEVITTIGELMGREILEKFGMLVFTGGDSFAARTKDMEFETWVRGQKDKLRDLIKLCRNRCVLFNNITQDKSILHQQRQVLISVIRNKMPKLHDQYNSKYFVKAREVWYKNKERKTKLEAMNNFNTKLGEIQVMISKQKMKGGKPDEDLKQEMKGEINKLGEMIPSLDISVQGNMRHLQQTLLSSLDELDKMAGLVEKAFGAVGWLFDQAFDHTIMALFQNIKSLFE